jgi:hypothetical protein
MGLLQRPLASTFPSLLTNTATYSKRFFPFYTYVIRELFVVVLDSDSTLV